ncbi:hypothetical protein [Variovorax sp. GB1P17]|uniref:hypothetical protein n=1 Tax=Variovorax sp. GB1P17 TaxID=3443740 RepID=UPI003F4593B3
MQDMTAPIQQQKISMAWRWRRERSVGLGLKMGLFRPALTLVNIAGKNFHSTHYEATRVGNIFYKAPAFIQSGLIASYLYFYRISAVATRFKWVAGIASFGALAIKVWHTGLISNWWIALSAMIGLVIGFFATLFH